MSIKCSRCTETPVPEYNLKWAECIQSAGIYKQEKSSGRLIVVDAGVYFWWSHHELYRCSEQNSAFKRMDERLIVDVK